MGLCINVLHFPLGCWILCVFRECFGLSSDGKNVQTYQLPQSLSWGLTIPAAVLGADWSRWREGKASPLPFLYHPTQLLPLSTHFYSHFLCEGLWHRELGNLPKVTKKFPEPGVTPEQSGSNLDALNHAETIMPSLFLACSSFMCMWVGVKL